MPSKAIKSLFAFLLLMLIVGCSSTEIVKKDNAEVEEVEEVEEVSGELRVAYASAPATLDPYLTVSIQTPIITRHFFETLVVKDSNDNIQPMLADSWEQSKDNKEITFYLREGIKFHNGDELVADDVVASLNRWINVTNYKEVFEGSTVEALDDYTVAVHFPEPVSTALEIFAHTDSQFSAIMPREVVEAADETTGIKEYIGTGPFQLEEWAQDRYIHLKRFEDYQPRNEKSDSLAGKREALVEDLFIEFVSDAATQAAGLQTGEYDVVHRFSPDMIDQIIDDPSIEHKSYATGQYKLYLNKKAGIFTDKTARQAIQLALDSDLVLMGTYSSDEFYDLNHDIMGANQAWYSDVGKDKYNQYKPEEAKKLLEEAGYNGEEISFLVRNIDEHRKGAIVIQQQLEQIGLNVKLDILDGEVGNELLQDENAWDMTILSSYPKPEPGSIYYINNKDYTGWTDTTESVKIISKLRHASSPEESQEAYDELQRWVYDYIPLVRLGDFHHIIAYRDTVKNIEFYGQPFFWNVTNEK